MDIKKTWKYCILIVIVMISGILYYKNDKKDTKEDATVYLENSMVTDSVALIPSLLDDVNSVDVQEKQQKSETNITTKDEFIYIHVCGAVKNPGVYELAKESRVIDAVMLAGGFNENAAKDVVNQAQKVSDGVRLYIPTFEEVNSDSNLREEYSFVAVQQDEVPSKINDVVKGKININTADKAALMTLPGIGESKAQSIISYRETNGAFASIQDLQKISGIKEAVFNKIKDNITVTE